MPITWNAQSSGLVFILFTDPYSTEEAERAMKEIYADGRIRQPLRFLVDVRHSATPDTEFVNNAITFWQLHVDKMWGAKIAVVAAHERQVTMANMSERTAEARELPFTLRAFGEDERADAERWLMD
jgi:stage II sporulation SpoAA-like protein